jgi:hypothetical protein
MAACTFQLLPQELFETIVGLAMLESTVQAALRWRRVDRRFRNAIEPLLLRTGRLLHGPRGPAYASRCVWPRGLAVRLLQREFDGPVDLLPPELRHCVRLLETRLLGLRSLVGGSGGGGDAYAAAVRRGVCELLVRASQLHRLGVTTDVAMLLFHTKAFPKPPPGSFRDPVDKDFPERYVQNGSGNLPSIVIDRWDANFMSRWLALSEADVQEIGLSCPQYRTSDEGTGWRCLDAAAMAVAALGLGGHELLRHLAQLDACNLTASSMFGQPYMSGNALSALSVAAEVGNVEGVGILLPLCTELATRKGKPLVKQLLRRALETAAEHGHLSIFEEILQHATQGGLLDDSIDRTTRETILAICFIAACVGGHVELAGELLGRIPNKEERLIGSGMSTVSVHERWATHALLSILDEPWPSPTVFEYLISQGARLQGQFEILMDFDKHRSWTQDGRRRPLPQAICRGHLSMVRLLLEEGATGEYHQMLKACDEIIQHDDPDMLKLILEEGTVLAPPLGITPPHQCADKADKHMLSMLLRRSLSPWSPRAYQVLLDYDVQHNAGRAALEVFARPGDPPPRHTHYLRPLLDAGLLHGGGGDAATRALHLAIHTGDGAIMGRLLERGVFDLVNAEMVYEYYRFELGELPGLVAAPALVQVCTPLARAEVCVDELHAPRLRPYRRAFEALVAMLVEHGGVSSRRKMPPGPELDAIPKYYKGGMSFFCGATDREKCASCGTNSWAEG